MNMGDARCAMASQTTPIHDYARLVQHLREAVPVALAAASAELDVAVVADRQFTQAHGPGSRAAVAARARAAVAARMNVVDGIFAEQVGVQLNVTEIRTLSNNRSLSSFNASQLLNDFSRFASSSSFDNPGISHLFTGRDLQGGTVGIAYLRSLCSNRFGVGLSQVRGRGTAGALIVAHEIGHNFGAPHDNQRDSACEGTPGRFLMNSTINGSDEFSSCSLSQIQPNVDAASCLKPISQPSPPERSLFRSTFNWGRSGFSYADNAFGTTRGAYVSGRRLANGGQTGGALRVLLGGIDNNDILNMSGGWRRRFSLSTAANVSVSIRYRVNQSASYESDEVTEAWLAIDGRLVSNTANRYLARVVGNGEGGNPRSSGWRSTDVNLGRLAAGSHTLTVGGFNNKKTVRNEVSEVRIDDVVVTIN
ncbi:MAG: M12 family metallo-peptidase, partial [Gammaproteobacteria bacterium]